MSKELDMYLKDAAELRTPIPQKNDKGAIGF